MTIQEFENKYLSNNVDLKTILEVRTYLPIAEKKAILETVFDKCYTVEDGVLAYDCVLKRIVFELAMIKYHTNLDIDIMSEDDYDTINCICGLNTLHKEYYEDYIECQLILDAMEHEMFSKYSIETSILRLSNQLSTHIKHFVQMVENKIEDLDMSKFGFDSVELEQFKQLINKYGK